MSQLQFTRKELQKLLEGQEFLKDTCPGYICPRDFDGLINKIKSVIRNLDYKESE